jgi:hypothetical protein
MLMQPCQIKCRDAHLHACKHSYVAPHTYIDGGVYVTGVWSHYSVLHSCKTRDTFVPQLAGCANPTILFNLFVGWVMYMCVAVREASPSTIGP